MNARDLWTAALARLTPLARTALAAGWMGVPYWAWLGLGLFLGLIFSALATLLEGASGARLVNTWAACAAFTASAALGYRANLLKPKAADWHNAPAWVWASMIALSVALALVALWIVRTPAACVPPLVAVVFTVQAGEALAMLLNLVRQTRPAEAAQDPGGQGAAS